MANKAAAKETADTLFDLQQCSNRKACKNCGQEFLPQQKRQVFCCPKCKRTFFHRKTDQEIQARFELIQHTDVPLPENLSDKDKEAVELYTKRNYGIRAIARWQNRNHTVVRNALIKAGVFKLKTGQNRRDLKGTGPCSRILQKQRIEEREKEWRHKMAVCLWNYYRNRISVKATCDVNGWRFSSILCRLNERQGYRKWSVSNPPEDENFLDHRQVRILRHRVAVCLRNFRYGKAIETTCHENGWNPSLVWNYLHKSKAYKKLKAARPSKAENVKQYKDRSKWNWHSKIYLEESDFQKVIRQLLEESGMVCDPEKQLRHSQSRADFGVNGSIYVDCKISTKPFWGAIGQAVHYKNEGKEVWIVIPDDVAVRSDQLETLEKDGIQVLSETTLREKLAGREVVQVQTKTTGIQKQ